MAVEEKPGTQNSLLHDSFTLYISREEEEVGRAGKK